MFTVTQVQGDRCVCKPLSCNCSNLCWLPKSSRPSTRSVYCHTNDFHCKEIYSTEILFFTQQLCEICKPKYTCRHAHTLMLPCTHIVSIQKNCPKFFRSCTLLETILSLLSYVSKKGHHSRWARNNSKDIKSVSQAKGNRRRLVGGWILACNEFQSKLPSKKKQAGI